VWTWLAQRFGGELFPGIEEVRDTTREMVQLMERGLQVCCRLHFCCPSAGKRPVSAQATLARPERSAASVVSSFRQQAALWKLAT
jgi:hypothetical protein